MAKAAQAVIVIHLLAEFDDFERAPQVDIEAALLGLAVQRGRTMNDGVGRMDQTIVIFLVKTELLVCKITAIYANAGLQVFVKSLEIEMQLQRVPEALFRLVRIFSAHQHVNRGAEILQQVGGNMRADVSGRAGQEY